MRAVVQRVTRASVTIAGEVVGKIDVGLMVLLGVAAGDEAKDAIYLAEKIAGLRIFEDDAAKMNLSVRDVNGAMLVVSQFTLLGDCRGGRRPGFSDAAPPDVAVALYESFVSEVRKLGLDVATGRFREHMEVELVNDGPVTMLLDSKKLF